MHRRTLLILVAVLLAGTCANRFGPGNEMVVPHLSWPGDGGRFTVKMAQGPDERSLLTRLVFTSPTPANTSAAFARMHAPLIFKDSDTASKAGVSDAPHPLMRRTRASFRHSEHYLQAAVVPDGTLGEYAAGWTSLSRWTSALMLGPQSALWSHFQCYRLGTQSLDVLSVHQSSDVCAGHVNRSDSHWHVELYDYSVPRDVSIGGVHARRYDALLLGEARLVSPVMNLTQRANALGCRNSTCRERVRVEHLFPTYPVVLDLESQRNYLPVGLYTMPAGDRRLVFSFGESDIHDKGEPPLVIDLDDARIGSRFTVNVDSQEIILGIDFVRANYTHVVYDAKERIVALAWMPLVAPEGVRILETLLVIALGALVVRWIASRNFATMERVVGVIETTSARDVFVIPFDEHQTGYEVSAVILSALALGLLVPYVDSDYWLLVMVLAVQWALHVLITLLILVVTNVQRRLLTAPRYVIARNAIHVLVIGNGVLFGMLLSTDSSLVMLVALVVVLLIVYHMAYYLGTMIVCSIGLASVSPGRSVWCHTSGWSVYMTLEFICGAVVLGALHQLLFVPVVQAMNSFYAPVLVATLSAMLLLTALALGVYKVFAEATD